MNPVCKTFLTILMLGCLTAAAAKVPHNITVGINAGFPPYEFRDEHGKAAGANIDLLKLIEKQSKLHFRFHTDDWQSIRSGFENDEIILLAGMIRTPALERKYLFCKPHTYIYYSVFVRSGTPAISGWEDMNGRQILLENGSPLVDLLKAKAPSAQILYAANAAQALETLSNGTADGVILPKIQGYYYITQLNLDNLAEACNLGDPLEYCFALPQGYGELQKELDGHLSAIINTYRLKTIQNKWFGIYDKDVSTLETHSRQYNNLLLLMLFALAVVGVLIILSFNRLKHQKRYLDLQVAERNNYEKEYYQRHQLFVSGPIVFLKWSDARRDMFESISDNFSLFGYNPQDLLNGRIKYQNIIHPDDLERVMQERQQHLDRGENCFNQIYRIICPPLPGKDEGFEVVNTWHYRNLALAAENIVHIRWVYDYTVALPVANSATCQYYGYLLEITAQKKIENELEKQHQAAQVAINTKDIFLTSMSIEINSPLNALIGLTRKLSDFTLDEEQRSALQIITSSALHLKQILQQIHDFLAILKGSIGSVPQWYVLKRLMEPVIEEFQIKIASKRIAFEHNEFQPTALVFLDADWLQKIVRIIMDNAVKFTQEGRISLTVDLHRPRHGKDELLITVADTGIGIPPDKLQLIMEPFTQADETFTRKFGGVGLGLSIARNLLVQMNGVITIDSVPEQGTTVKLRFPVITRR
jgi:two-component system sensor histidine kinase EvgS